MLSVPSIPGRDEIERKLASHPVFANAIAKVREKGSETRHNVTSRHLENIVSAHISPAYMHHQTRLGDAVQTLPENDNLSFLKVVCYLAYLSTLGNLPSGKELSIILLHVGYGALADVRLFDVLIDNKDAIMSYTFVDSSVQHMLTAVYLLSQPIMKVFDFMKQYMMFECSDTSDTRSSEISVGCMCTLQYYFGLADCKILANPRGILTNIISFLCQYVHTSQPIVDDRIALLLINCVYQAHDKTQCIQVNHEFQRQIFSYKIHLLEQSFESFLFFLKSTSHQGQPPWVVYCMEERKGEPLKSVCTVTVNVHLTNGDRERLVISNKNLDYLHNVLVPVNLRSDIQSDTMVSSSDVGVHLGPGGRVLATPTTDPTHQDNKDEVALCPYGYLTRAQLESQRRISIVAYFNIVKDLMSPQLQLHSHTLVSSQYRKSDHIWFSFPVAMRHKFYENVAITPYVPLHWVKVCTG